MSGILETTALLALVAASGGENGHEAHGIDWFELGSMFLNFVLLFGFLGYKLRPVVANGLKSRRENFGKRLIEAQQKQAEAESRLEEYKAKLANLETEFQRVVESYEAEARADQQKMEEETEKAIQRLARETDFTIHQEFRKAEKLIQSTAVEATLRKAEGLVRDRITDDDRARLNDACIEELGRN